MDNLYDFTNKRKLNKKHILLAILCIVFLILFAFIICRAINVSILKFGSENDAEKMKNMQDTENKEIENQVVQNEVIESEEKEKNIERFKSLSSDELDKIEKIYNHSDTKRVFLTFDDGPTKQVTPYILDVLKQKNVKANFFVLGYRVDQNPDIVKQEYDDGNFIGNHTYSHKYSSLYESIDSFFNEFNNTQQSIRNATGNSNYNSLVCRLPGGSTGGPYNDIKKDIKSKLKEQGIGNIDWNALTNDADGAKTKETIMSNFYSTIEDKTSIVLLMHDSADKILTYETLPDIIQYLQDNGYKFETIYDAIDRN